MQIILETFIESKLDAKAFCCDFFFLDMYALNIIQKVNSKNSLNVFKYSTIDNSDSCVLKRLSLPQHLEKILQRFSFIQQIAPQISGNQPEPEEWQSEFWALRMGFHPLSSGKVRVNACLYLVTQLLTSWFCFQ